MDNTPTPASRRGEQHSLPGFSAGQFSGSVNRASNNHAESSRTSSHGTPQKGGKNGEFVTLEEKQREPYRRELVKELERERSGQDAMLSLPDLMHTLGLDERYAECLRWPLTPFEQIAQSLPTVRYVARRKRQSADSGLVEGDYVACFKLLLETLAKPPTDFQSPTGTDVLCKFKDCQNAVLESSPLRPDIAFYRGTSVIRDFKEIHFVLEAKRHMSRSEAYSSYLGQLADYALELKTLQPMRQFVPILFLYGCHLDLVVFTHGGHYRADIGHVLFKDDNECELHFGEVSMSLRHLWFLLTLPADEFGHLVQDFRPFKRAHLNSTTQPASFTPMYMPGMSNLTDIRQIERRVHMTGRCTYLFNVKYRNVDAILKLSWIRTNRLPEGAVYKVLEAEHVPNIPEVFDSGILVESFCGYRLEYLVVQHCGVSIVDYIQSMRKEFMPDPVIAAKVEECVAHVVHTLTAALRARIIHRDISAGNITVKGGRVFVIDWGCAKFMVPPSVKLAAMISERWRFDCTDVIPVEQAKDPFTGTALYMSIQMLLRVRQRSIFNDIESLFYVILDALSTRSRERGSEDAPGFVMLSELSAAYMRLGCLFSDSVYLMNFGVDESKPFVPKAMLDAMYKFLFYEGNSFIGNKLQIRSGYERAIDPVTAAMFMHSATLESLQEVYKASEQPTQVMGTPTRDLSDARTPDPTPGVLTMPAVSEPPPPPPQPNFGNFTLASNSIMDAEDPFSQ
ncbi:hypothetical protein GGF42_007342, partial [Coemansia sp. RSA 2424]